jgi:SOS-response transcriptional repressor LexA
MNTEKLRSIIRESINEYIKDIDEAGTKAMYEAKMKACDEAIEKRMKKIEMAESLEEMQGMFDESKMKDLKTEIKALEKQKAKYGKMLEKLNKGKEIVAEEPVEEAPVDEADVTAEMDTTNEEEQMEEEISINESFLKMQKLAGVITEAEYRTKTDLI